MCATVYCSELYKKAFAWFYEQAGASAYRALRLLRRQPGFWRSLGDCLGGIKDGVTTWEVPRGGSPAAWVDSEPETWRFVADSAALSIISSEALSFPDPDGAAPAPYARSMLFTSHVEVSRGKTTEGCDGKCQVRSKNE